MDEIMNRVGSYWVSKRANEDIDSLGDDFASLSIRIEEGARWLVNKLKEKMQKPLPDLLKDHDLPVGIFLRDATNYELHEQTGKLTVFMPSICDVGYRDASVLRFSTFVSGYLQRGKLGDVHGVKAVVMLWFKVTSVTSEGLKLHFAAGVKRTRNRVAY